MKKIIALMAVVSLGLLWSGCGSDDDNGTNGGTTTPRIQANSTVAAPSATDANDAVWALVDSVTLDVSGGIPAGAKAEPGAVPATIQVKAINKGGNLYLRMKWADASMDAYPLNYLCDDNVPPINFDHTTDSLIYLEDQIYVFFDGAAGGQEDVWHWKVLTTGGARMAKGARYNVDAGSFVDDAPATPPIAPVLINAEASSFRPLYCDRDSSELVGPVFHLVDVVEMTDTVRIEVDSVLVGEVWVYDSTAIRYYDTEGWALGQMIPGYIIDTAQSSKSVSQRGSLWDIDAVSDYAEGEYALVLSRQLTTGFADDANLGAVDSVQVWLGVFDNQYSFETGGVRRGFTGVFWLVL